MSGLAWESCGARIHSHQLVGLQSHTWNRYTMLASPIHCPQTHFTCLRCLYSEFQWHILNYYLSHLSFHVGPWPHHTWMCGKRLADKRVTSYKILPITHGSQSLIHENELTNSSGGSNKGMFLPCSLQFLPPRQRALWHSWFSLKRCVDQAKRVSKPFHFSIPDWRQVQVCAGSDTSSFNTPPTPPKKVSYCPAPSHSCWQAPWRSVT